MSSFTILLICIQACLIQAVFSTCGCGMRSIPIPPAPRGCGCGKAPKVDTGLYSLGAGDVSVVGELPISGRTTVAGSVPVLGSLDYYGEVPAYGSVSISGASAYPEPSYNVLASAELAALEGLSARWYKPACGCY